ncbi:NAD-dependent epimerase/dehydratase [Methylobacterium sp. 4-46]|uniref:NAD-dependent epimerase/dehydratase family protein n=1 Tax=unclassified Methylobacterium TaxID=2615210 RepID=UPI000152D943|nr:MULTISPECIES: NAD-dependent epimerase/dehydratase family protein [Methylobacterium]ACA16540.1 NAD-dependent epimerase/dehydratase [Methylobacterium sp. 4-46]WFT82250.1 NAD-dependent epimerase/dehydratase family protein [Methylobacterium nodulans]
MSGRSDGGPILITGGAGFIGANLADALAAEGRDVLIYDALLRPGVEANLDWLKRRHPRRVSAVVADVRDTASLSAAAARAGAVFHFAAQVAVTTSLVAPAEDFAVNLGATLALLEALRGRPDPAPLLFSSTNKVYGDLGDLAFRREGEAYRPAEERLHRHGIGEDRSLDFHTPYGCSKGGADQYVLDYARSFGVPTCVMRMSCIYGPRQMGTEDQGWVAHFLIRALEGQPIAIYGDGCQVRDILHVADAVAAYRAALARIDLVSGRAYNLGGGPANAVSLRQVLAAIRDIVGRPLDLSFHDWRAGDQRYYVSDTRRAGADLDLAAPIPWRRGLADLARWLAEARGLALPESAPRREPEPVSSA